MLHRPANVAGEPDLVGDRDPRRTDVGGQHGRSGPDELFPRQVAHVTEPFRDATERDELAEGHAVRLGVACDQTGIRSDRERQVPKPVRFGHVHPDDDRRGQPVGEQGDRSDTVVALEGLAGERDRLGQQDHIDVRRQT